MIGGKPVATAAPAGGKKPAAAADDNDDPIAASLALRMKAGGLSEVVPNAADSKKVVELRLLPLQLLIKIHLVKLQE